MTTYVGLATGVVAHIVKEDSFVRCPGETRGYSLTLCGRRVASNWFEAGIDPYGHTKPNLVPLCRTCAKMVEP